MSTAGIHSNRGDSYQTLVAFDWALTVLTNPEFLWIEVDSTLYPVDDVVIGKADGSKICCQCKKNEPEFNSWSIAELTDELDKASKLLNSNNNIQIRFYSRSPFGTISKLREHCATQPNEISFISSLGKGLKKIDSALLKQLSSNSHHLSTYNFLRQLSFEISPELNRMEELLRERLLYIACNPTIAYDAIWVCLNQMGARINKSNPSASSKHRLTKDDLKSVLHNAGAMLASVMSLSEISSIFSTTSAIGRSWQRDIGKQCIPIPLLYEIISVIESGKRSILITGLPGSGKTCLMLALQDELEKRAIIQKDLLPLFIQAREFADQATSNERQAQGLPEQWVEKVARSAEHVRVVVVIDSLDVLSISREHNVLTYFLAQIDRLLLVPNVTVITTCRDFDRSYDFRIAQRRWEYETKCAPLNWESDILPLLDKLGITIPSIDGDTRELIRNPRELALYVELAQRGGGFNVINSQALAERYLEIIVLKNSSLGTIAMHAIEDLADEMLKTRKLAVPSQRFTGSQDIQRLLCSLNILQLTQRNEISFGHQTLLDALSINRAIRKNHTLNTFIGELPPVPFVRPSIRRFISYLAMGDRREFRKQLRTVLTGDSAFHIRRLVAESFAEQMPEDDDWSLIRELKDNHPEVFQIIYRHARHLQWHRFWLCYLVPMLKDAKNSAGMMSHAHLISQWINEDPLTVIELWIEIFDLTWIDSSQFSAQLSHYLSNIDDNNLSNIVPLIDILIKIPRSEHSSLGRVLARCVSAELIDDNYLWQFIINDINDDDINKFSIGDKLRCQAHEFGNSQSDFLNQRMKCSVSLLNYALSSVEQWSKIKSSAFGAEYKGRYSNFLHFTSHEDVHSHRDYRHHDSESILLDSMENAILHHVDLDSAWWKQNRDRLGFNHEGALRYFAIQALITNPILNIDLIGRILADYELYTSDFSFELGTLIEKAFIYLPVRNQDIIEKGILRLQEELLAEDNTAVWIFRRRANLVAAIPCYLRSADTQTMLDKYEKINGRLIRQPNIVSTGGVVVSPFPFHFFLQISDVGIIKLLNHYAGLKNHIDDFLIGGEDELAIQLCEASSRHPARFISLVEENWDDISGVFRDAIIDGISRYLNYRFGNLQIDSKWEPVEEPDAASLSNRVLTELEKHNLYWHHNRAASNIILACAHVIKGELDATRLIILSRDFIDIPETMTGYGDSVDLITKGINMISGHIIEALMILAINSQNYSSQFSELLLSTLNIFAESENLAHRAVILRHLPYLQHKNHKMGWELFHRTMIEPKGLWSIAEPCLYYSYNRHYNVVAPLLKNIITVGEGKDYETWGRISALTALSNFIDNDIFINDITVMENINAWRGALSVWTHPYNIKKDPNHCYNGIKAGLNSKSDISRIVTNEMSKLFRHRESIILLPADLIHLFFTTLKNNGDVNKKDIIGIDEWLNDTAQYNPNLALDTAEEYLSYIEYGKIYIYDTDNNLTQLMTRLFAEAEEREESDKAVMLERVVLLQDKLLSLGINGVNEWLKAAERP